MANGFLTCRTPAENQTSIMIGNHGGGKRRLEANVVDLFYDLLDSRWRGFSEYPRRESKDEKEST